MKPRPSSFLWRYLRGYTGWAMLAAAGILVYAAATAGTAALIKPIFGEVLLAGDSVPGPLGAITGVPGEPARATREAASPACVADLKKRLNVAHQIDEQLRVAEAPAGGDPRRTSSTSSPSSSSSSSCCGASPTSPPATPSSTSGWG